MDLRRRIAATPDPSRMRAPLPESPDDIERRPSGVGIYLCVEAVHRLETRHASDRV